MHPVGLGWLHQLDDSVEHWKKAIHAVSQRPIHDHTEFGPNEWLVDELHQQYLEDKNSVDPAWWEFFADYQPSDTPLGPSRADDGARGTRSGRGPDAPVLDGSPAPAAAAVGPGEADGGGIRPNGSVNGTPAPAAPAGAAPTASGAARGSSPPRPPRPAGPARLGAARVGPARSPGPATGAGGCVEPLGAGSRRCPVTSRSPSRPAPRPPPRSRCSG